MNREVTTAVILAAGLGSRLKGLTEDKPKGFLEIDGLSLIERSITSLLRARVNNIVIGTGYLHDHFELLKQKYPITTFRSVDYSTTGSMYTLYVLRHLIGAPFLLLESDLLYDPAALTYLQEDPLNDIILASGPTNSGDEVYIQASSDNKLQQMSKSKSALKHVSGELVGITKLSLETLGRMCTFSKMHYEKGNLMLNYEDALVGVAASHPLQVKVIEDLVWCEIDDDNHLNRALNIIYPRIKEKIS